MMRPGLVLLCYACSHRVRAHTARNLKPYPAALIVRDADDHPKNLLLKEKETHYSKQPKKPIESFKYRDFILFYFLAFCYFHFSILPFLPSILHNTLRSFILIYRTFIKNKARAIII